jgi:D-glycero-D-manno-heptose 1,7-bisphosphate phosphatase
MIKASTMFFTHHTTDALRKAPAIFLDRDGTINVEKHYLHRIEDWEWITGAAESIRQFNQAGFKVIVVSNQAGIARGMYARYDVDRLHVHILKDLQKHGAAIDAFYYCPHHPEYGEGRNCVCRKPSPNMLYHAATALSIDLSNSWMIGDKLIDIQAGQAASVSSILVRTGYGNKEIGMRNHNFMIAEDIASAAKSILNQHTANTPQS